MGAIYLSIQRWGFNGALRVWYDRENPDVDPPVVIAGNHTYLALLQMQDEGCDVPTNIDVGPDGDWCGDSTDPEQVARLMDGERAVLSATDPPYLVAYDGTNLPQKWETVIESGDGNKDWSEVYDDRWDDPSQGEALYDGFVVAAMAEAITEDHPTARAVELFELPMLEHTSRGDLCYEPFVGSGTQHVAAERLGRVCYGIEIQPAFVAVTLQRLKEMGLQPRLVDTLTPDAATET